MVSFSKLAELSSGNIGFAGGSAVDTKHGMSFSECANAFNDYLSEQAIADYEREEACDEQLFEAAVMSMQYGDSSILESTMANINESDDSGSKATVWERIKGVFRKIKEFFTSLLAKFTSWIAMHIKDGKSFYDSYIKKFNDSKNIVEVKVHKFNQLDKTIKSANAAANIDNVMSKLVPNIKDINQVTAEEAKKLAPELKIDRSKVRSAVYEVVGISTEDKLEKYLIGDEDTVKYSKVNKNEIRQHLVESSDIAALKSAYSTVIAEANKKMSMAQASASEKDDTYIAAYAKAYSALYNAVSSELNKLFSTCVKVYKKRIMEYKKIMRAVIVGKDITDEVNKASDDSDSIEDRDDDDKYAEFKRQQEEMEAESVGFDGFDFDL